MSFPQSLTPTQEYHPATCYTVDELRARGIAVPDHIPGNAWVPSSSMTADLTKVTSCGELPSELSIYFNAPIRWIDLSVAIESPTKDDYVG